MSTFSWGQADDEGLHRETSAGLCQMSYHSRHTFFGGDVRWRRFTEASSNTKLEQTDSPREARIRRSHLFALNLFKKNHCDVFVFQCDLMTRRCSVKYQHVLSCCYYYSRSGQKCFPLKFIKVSAMGLCFSVTSWQRGVPQNTVASPVSLLIWQRSQKEIPSLLNGWKLGADVRIVLKFAYWNHNEVALQVMLGAWSTLSPLGGYVLTCGISVAGKKWTSKCRDGWPLHV